MLVDYVREVSIHYYSDSDFLGLNLGLAVLNLFPNRKFSDISEDVW